MPFRWPYALVAPFAARLWKYRNGRRAAFDFGFRRRPMASGSERTPGQLRVPGVYVTHSGQKPFLRSWSESFTLARAEFPALTVTANAGRVLVTGTARPDWSLRYLAYGDGDSEAEALKESRQFSFDRLGSTIRLDGPRFPMHESGAELAVDGPADAPITVHGSFAPVQVYGMSGPVQVAAIHARTSILNTTGTVAASSFVVDFAGSQGAVTLSAESEINLKFTSTKFNGTLMAWAQGHLRALVPRGSQTAFQAYVNRPRDFLCRTEFRKKVKHRRSGGLHVFTYEGDGSAPPENVHLRSEHGNVVIDDAVPGRRQLAQEFRRGTFEDYT